MARIIGTSGNDTLFGTQDDDSVLGLEGDDELRGGGGNDTVIGGEGDDIVGGEQGDDRVIGGEGNDRLFWTGDGNDTLLGGEGDDHFEFFAFGPAVHLEVSGGEGVDKLFYFVGRDTVINLQEGTSSGVSGSGTPITMTLQSIEHVDAILEGGLQFIGSSADNAFSSFGNSNDTMSGGAGRDTLFGGSLDDVYVFDAAPGEANADEIVFDKFDEATHGFSENDRIALDSSVMPELGATGDFSGDDERFYAAAGATGGAEEDDRVIYDTESGKLYYDADGSGTFEAQLIATLSTGGFDLAAGDITVI